MKNPKRLEIVGLKELENAFTEIGQTRTKARTQINKALQPAAKIAQRAAKQKYKQASKHKTPGKRYDPSTKKSIIGRTLADSIQVITATKSREPGLLVGPRVKGRFKSANWSGNNNVNLAQLLIRGSKGVRSRGGVLPKQPDHLLKVAKEKGNQVLQVAQRDMSKLLDKVFRKQGFI
tara:strand:- start:239 stop:769 length:531 start_codon:yes stop_codon:yes gene_type:complete